MNDFQGHRERRPVMVQTLNGLIEGCLIVSPRVRTLDEVNVASSRFLHVDVGEDSLPSDSFESGSLGLSKSSILFVAETAETRSFTDHRIERSHFIRCGVRLRLGDHDVQGFIHIRGLSDPMMRLGQARDGFIALTAASVVGPELEFATSFLAVNTQLISAAQSLVEMEITAGVAVERNEVGAF